MSETIETGYYRSVVDLDVPEEKNYSSYDLYVLKTRLTPIADKYACFIEFPYLEIGNKLMINISLVGDNAKLAKDEMTNMLPLIYGDMLLLSDYVIRYNNDIIPRWYIKSIVYNLDFEDNIVLTDTELLIDLKKYNDYKCLHERFVKDFTNKIIDCYRDGYFVCNNEFAKNWNLDHIKNNLYKANWKNSFITTNIVQFLAERYLKEPVRIRVPPYLCINESNVREGEYIIIPWAKTYEDVVNQITSLL